jgi:putative aldouronate transport system permease protein
VGALDGGTASLERTAHVLSPKKRKNARKLSRRNIRKQRTLLLMSVPVILYFCLFEIVPLWGWMMAFRNYKVGLPLWDAEWIGLAKFKELILHPDFLHVIRNTFMMNGMHMVLGFACSIAFAVLLTELNNKWFMKTVQTMTYLPHFISWVVIANIAVMMLSPDGGLINVMLMKLGLIDKGIYFFAKGEWFWVLHTVIVTWKEFGFNAIIFLAVIVSIDPALYEAAHVDGAGRWQRIKHVTLPAIVPVLVLLLIMTAGRMVTQGFESQYLLGNQYVIEYSEVVSILALRLGINEGDLSLGTAVGIFNTVVSVATELFANWLAKKYTNTIII